MLLTLVVTISGHRYVITNVAYKGLSYPLYERCHIHSYVINVASGRLPYPLRERYLLFTVM